jgi:hypothetical protein
MTELCLEPLKAGACVLFGLCAGRWRSGDRRPEVVPPCHCACQCLPIPSDPCPAFSALSVFLIIAVVILVFLLLREKWCRSVAAAGVVASCADARRKGSPKGSLGGGVLQLGH